MLRPRPEQSAEYETWLKDHPDSNISPEVIKSVIDDDVAEEKAADKKKAGWSREYNAKSIASVPGNKLLENGKE